MSLSTGQVEDVLRRAGVDTGRAQEFTGRGEFEGMAGQEQLLSELTGGRIGGGGGGGNVAGLAQQLLSQMRQAAQPAVEALQKESTSLKTRYDTLLEGMKKQQQTSLSREFGRRGISPTSGLFEQTFAEQFQPIQENIVSQRESGLAALASKIAQISTGDTSNAYNIALNMIQQQQQAEQGAADRLLRQQQFEQEQQKNRYISLGEGNTLFDLLTNQLIYKNPKTYKPSDQPGNWE